MIYTKLLSLFLALVLLFSSCEKPEVIVSGDERPFCPLSWFYYDSGYVINEGSTSFLYDSIKTSVAANVLTVETKQSQGTEFSLLKVSPPLDSIPYPGYGQNGFNKYEDAYSGDLKETIDFDLNQVDIAMQFSLVFARTDLPNQINFTGLFGRQDSVPELLLRRTASGYTIIGKANEKSVVLASNLVGVKKGTLRLERLSDRINFYIKLYDADAKPLLEQSQSLAERISDKLFVGFRFNRIGTGLSDLTIGRCKLNISHITLDNQGVIYDEIFSCNTLVTR